jgi:hypothetical protein
MGWWLMRRQISQPQTCISKSSHVSNGSQTTTALQARRWRSDSARDDKDDRDPGPRDGKLMDDLMADLENGNMPLDERLVDMGLDPKEYKAYDTLYPPTLQSYSLLGWLGLWVLIVVQVVELPAQSRGAPREMGAQDPRRSTGEMERDAEDAGSLDAAAYVQARGC